ncbi:hypothetical protein FBUS_08206 [Fasciolopsis buskii]|uniref:Uncharacterized protein n=1 Tax=Fasciolopsis buskii TaxID=27845 RepID=A0A8E0RZB5_9TREM|nr:hypothetical protein FBUS_08206 [Fasciolopsis buski]
MNHRETERTSATIVDIIDQEETTTTTEETTTEETTTTTTTEETTTTTEETTTEETTTTTTTEETTTTTEETTTEETTTTTTTEETTTTTEETTTEETTTTTTEETTTTTVIEVITTTAGVAPISRSLDVIDVVTDNVRKTLVGNLTKVVCLIPNSLFIVHIVSFISPYRYGVKIYRIDKSGFTQWNSTLVNPVGDPLFEQGQSYLLLGSKQLSISPDSTSLDLSTLPSKTFFIPLRDVKETIKNMCPKNYKCVTNPGNEQKLKMLAYLISSGQVR